MKIEPILAVKNVKESSVWYQSVFNWRSRHGGEEFDVLVDEDDVVMLCLHKWGAHDHPTMSDSSETSGNGLILYFRLKEIESLFAKLQAMNYPLESDLTVSPNSGVKEFSLRDPNGYFITIADFHTYGL